MLFWQALSVTAVIVLLFSSIFSKFAPLKHYNTINVFADWKFGEQLNTDFY